MATELTLAALSRMYDAPEADSEVTIDRRNKDVMHWFNAHIDEGEIFVRLTRGEKAPVSAAHRARMEQVMQEHPEALRELLATPDARNNMLAVAGTGNYMKTEARRSAQDFDVTYGGQSLLDAAEPVRSFVASIRQVIDDPGLADGKASS